jgi:hypothetical protein
VNQLSLLANLQLFKELKPELFQEVRSLLQPGLDMPPTHLDWSLITDIAAACWMMQPGGDDYESKMHRMLWGSWIFHQHHTYCLGWNWLADVQESGSPSCGYAWEPPPTPVLLCFPVNSVLDPATGGSLDCLLVLFSCRAGIDDGSDVTSLHISGVTDVRSEPALWYAGFDIDGVGALLPHFSPQVDTPDEYASCNWLITLGEIALEASMRIF